MTEVYIGIGSNLGDRRQYIKDAISMLGETPEVKIDKVSPLYETEPVGGPPQGRFLNGVLSLKTGLSPRQLLKRLNEIEDSLGRERTVKNGPRTIDLDILTYGDLHIEEKDLMIPHPRMKERDFVMRPLNDIIDIR